MLYGKDLIEQLKSENELMRQNIENRYSRIDAGLTDIDDCFISQRCEERGISINREKIALIENGGCDWFLEYATLDGTLVNAKWCDTRYGYKLRAEMPDGKIVWTTADTKKGLAKKGLKKVRCYRPAWFVFRSSGAGMLGAYSGTYVPFPSDVNYATGEAAGKDPIRIEEI